MPSLMIEQFPCREDNFGVLVHDPATKLTAAIDAPDAAAVERALARTGWTLTHILVTHHHGDHVEGILPLKERHGAKVVANRADAHRIPGVDVTVEPGQSFRFGSHEAEIIDTPGHTVGHIAWHFPQANVAFVGDTLFSLGCGRVIEGTMDQMWSSLERLRRLPDDTKIYCGHEYTVANAKFALSVDPENPALQARAREADAERAQGKATLPVTIGAEKRENPFLRPEDPAIRRGLGMEKAKDAEVFGELRQRKNRF
ncbi:MAG: hydroxyacylglutathione hydrolase [Hyphomicrobiales bacterium]